MRSFFKALVLIPIVLALVVFAVANRHGVQVSLDPLSREAPLLAFELPLYLVAFLALALGIVIGGVASWLSQGKHRKAKRFFRREAERLRSEAETLRAHAQDKALAALPARRG